jgi:chromosome segregation ATPase
MQLFTFTPRPLPTSYHMSNLRLGTSSINTSGHSSPILKADPPSKAPVPTALEKERERTSVDEGLATGSTKPAYRAGSASLSLSTPALPAKMPPPLSAEALAEATQALGSVFESLIDEATTVSALKSQHHAVKRRAETRGSEFDKSKGHYDKFPSIKESQMSSKTKTEKELKIISDKMDKKNTLLKGLAIEAAEKLIPTLLARGGGDTGNQEKLQQRVDDLEKTCKELLDSQKTLLEEQREANQSLNDGHTNFAKVIEEKIVNLTNDIRSAQGQASSTASTVQRLEPKVEEALQKAKNSGQTIKSLQTDVSNTKGNAAKISTDHVQFSSDLLAKGQAIARLENQLIASDKVIYALRTKLEKFETGLNPAKDIEEQFKVLSEKLEKVSNQGSGLVTHVTELAKAQKKFREKFEKSSGEMEPLVTKEELDALTDRIEQMERMPASAASQPLPANTIIQGRLKAVEVDVSNLRSNDLAELNNRLSAVERKSSSTLAADHETSSAASTTPQLIKDLSTQLRSLEKTVGTMKLDIDAQDESFAHTIDDRLEEESEKLRSRISSLEEKSSELSDSLASRPQLNVDNTDIVKETTSRVVAAFIAKPELLFLARQPTTGMDESQMATIVNEVTKHLLAIVTAKPDLLPYLPTAHTNLVLNQALMPFQNSMEATNLSLGNLQSRVDNINSLDLARHILGQLYELHPDLPRIESLIVGFKGDLAAYKTDIQTKTTQLERLSNNVKALEEAVQTLKTSGVDQQGIEPLSQQVREIRKEVDKLTVHGLKMSKEVTALTTNVEKATTGVAGLQEENNANKRVIADQFANLTSDVDEKIEKLEKTFTRPPPAMPHRSTSNQNGVNRGPRPNHSTGNRQPSVASSNDNSSKKRKLDHVTSAKTNGVRAGSSSGHAKKRQRKFEEDDPEADPDYNEDIPEPGVSTDDEE